MGIGFTPLVGIGYRSFIFLLSETIIHYQNLLKIFKTYHFDDSFHKDKQNDRF